MINSAQTGNLKSSGAETLTVSPATTIKTMRRFFVSGGIRQHKTAIGGQAQSPAPTRGCRKSVLPWADYTA